MGEDAIEIHAPDADATADPDGGERPGIYPLSELLGYANGVVEGEVRRLEAASSVRIILAS